MKKHLLCTSAIALGVAAAAPASAQEWNVGIGGYYNTHIGFSDISGTAVPATSDFDGMEIVQDGEIIITPSITLDNGMTFGAQVQYETGGSGRYTDEVYITVKSDTFGTLDIGSENSAGYKMMWGAGTPSVGGVPINSGSMSGFVPFVTTGGFGGIPAPGAGVIANSFVGAGISQATEVGAGLYGNSDIQRISYYTPSFNGLTIGVSYAPDTAGTDGRSVLSNKNAVLSDVFDLGIGYSQSFGSTDVALAARWGTGDAPTAVGLSDPETWGVAATFTFGAFSVGGHYAENDNGIVGGALDQEGYGVGISYDAAGPWSFGLEYFYGEASHGAGLDSDEYEAIKLAANRNLGPGVDWAISLIQTEVDAADATGGGGLLGGVPGTDVKGTTLATSISLSF